jgi:hypothetical protein
VVHLQPRFGDVLLGVEPDVAILLDLLCGEPSAKLLSSRFEFFGSVVRAELLTHALYDLSGVLRESPAVGPYLILQPACGHVETLCSPSFLPTRHV